MGNDENWIKVLREAGRGYEATPVPGLWEELEGELFVACVARRASRTSGLWWYAAASIVVAAMASIYILCGRHNAEVGAPVLTIVTGEPSSGINAALLVEEDVEPLFARNERVGKETDPVSASEDELPGTNRHEIESYEGYSYYERIIVVEQGPDPMNNDCVLVSAGTDVGCSGNTDTYVGKDNDSRGIGGRIYASVSGASLSGGTPVSAGATIDMPLSDRLRLETGLEYTGIRAGGANDSYIGVPVKVSYDIYDQDRVRLYASAGGAVDKSLKRRDVSVSLNAGVGLEYSIDDDWGVFVEPGVEYRTAGGGSMPAAYGGGHAGPEVRVGFRHTFR